MVPRELRRLELLEVLMNQWVGQLGMARETHRGPRAAAGWQQGYGGSLRGRLYEMGSQIFLPDSQGPVGPLQAPTGPPQASPLQDYLMFSGSGLKGLELPWMAILGGVSTNQEWRRGWCANYVRQLLDAGLSWSGRPSIIGLRGAVDSTRCSLQLVLLSRTNPLLFRGFSA